MVQTDNTQIKLLANRIREKFKPEKIFLFGSYAYGNPNIASDVDLFVVMNTDIPVNRQAFLIRREFKESFPIDIIVRTPAQVEKRLEMGDYFIKKILDKGVLL